jgi:hypothetical protein
MANDLPRDPGTLYSYNDAYAHWQAGSVVYTKKEPP